MQEVINNSILVRHILNIIGVFFLLVIFTRQAPMDPLILVSATFLMYIFFILITRCDHRFLFVFIFLMVVVFYLETERNWIVSEIQDEKRKEKTQNTYMTIELTLEIISIFIVLIGTLVYLGQHSREYQNNWSWIFFWFGIIKCSGNGIPILKPISYDIIDGVRRLFGFQPKG